MKVRSISRVRRRLVDELSGLSAGLLADGELSDSEILFLINWTHRNQEVMKDWPFDKLLNLLERVSKNGSIQEERRVELIDFLLEISNSVFTDCDNRLSSALPLCNPEPVVSQGSFVLTGRFAYGSREQCEKLTIECGGRIDKSVKKSTNYLVIGAFVSEDWKHSTFGRKIERAIDLRNKCQDLSIISEEVWLKWTEKFFE